MKYLLCTLLAIFLLPICVNGQNDYLIRDSARNVGVKLIDGGNLKNLHFCRVVKGNDTLEFTPEEVSEYGFKDGRVFVSRQILLNGNLENVFLEKLTEGKLSLYYLKSKNLKQFYIEKNDSSFTQLVKKDEANVKFKTHLVQMTRDCPEVSGASKLVTFKKRSMKELIYRYNHCISKPFPHVKYGVFVGYEYLRLADTKAQYGDLEYFDFTYDGAVSLGAFVELPILVSDFSFRTELSFSSHAYTYSKNVDDADIDFGADLTSLEVPLLFKYSIPINNIRPFFNVGVVGSFFVKNETILNRTSIYNGQLVTVDLKDYWKVFQIDNAGYVVNYKEFIRPLVSDINFGYYLGAGLEIDLNYRKSLLIEFSYQDLYQLRKSEISGVSGFNVKAGISF